MTADDLKRTRTGRWLSLRRFVCCLFIALCLSFLSPAHGQTTNYVLGTTNLPAGPNAGANSVILGVTPATAGWTAQANATWLHLSSGDQSGTGNRNLIFSFDANTNRQARSGTITIGGDTLTITQACSSYVRAQTLFELVTVGQAGNPEQSNTYGVAVDELGNVYVATDPGVNWNQKSTRKSDTRKNPRSKWFDQV